MNQQNTLPTPSYPLQLQMQPNVATLIPLSISQLQQAGDQANPRWQLMTGPTSNHLNHVTYGKIPKDHHPISYCSRVRDGITRGGSTSGPLLSGRPTPYNKPGGHSKRRKGGKKSKAQQFGDPSQYIAIEGDECTGPGWDRS